MTHDDLTTLDLSRDWHELPSRADLLRARGARELDAPPPPSVQSPWDIPELVAVTTAVAGRVAREAETGIPGSFPVDFDGFKPEYGGQLLLQVRDEQWLALVWFHSRERFYSEISSPFFKARACGKLGLP